MVSQSYLKNGICFGFRFVGGVSSFLGVFGCLYVLAVCGSEMSLFDSVCFVFLSFWRYWKCPVVWLIYISLLWLID